MSTPKMAEKSLKKIYKKAGKKEDILRKNINSLTELLNEPISDISAVLHTFVKAGKKTGKHMKESGKSKEDISSLQTGIYRSLLMSIISTGMKILDISEDDMKVMMEELYEQHQEISNQEKEDNETD